jgi:hypothetical protein
VVSKPTVFISHIHEESALATAIQGFLSNILLNSISFFVSSDHRSIRAGDDWLQKIRTALSDACIVIVVVGPHSIDRTWINFESGAGWLAKRVIPLCHSGLHPDQLPQPLSSLYSLALDDPDDIRDLCSIVAESAGLATPNHDWQQAANVLASSVGISPTIRPSGAVDSWVFSSSDNTRTIDALNASLNRCRTAKLCSTGLNFLWNAQSLQTLIERVASGDLIAQICMGQFTSPHIKLRLEEEPEMPTGVPGAEHLIRKLVRFEQTIGDESRFSIRLFQHYPTYAMLIFDQEIYFYPYGFRTLGNLSPTFHWNINQPATQFFKQQFEMIFANSKPARKWYKTDKLVPADRVASRAKSAGRKFIKRAKRRRRS